MAGNDLPAGMLKPVGIPTALKEKPKFKATARLDSQWDRLGARSVSERKARGSKAKTKASAFAASLKSKTTESPKDSGVKVPRKGPKPYGSDKSASTHVHIFEAIETDNFEDCVSLVDRNQVQLSNILHVDQINMSALRDKYARHKAEVDADFRSKFGDKLDGVQDAARINARAKGASRYVISQVTIEITSEESFQGSVYDAERGLYVWIVRSKAVYTSSLLNPNALPKTPAEKMNTTAETTQGAVWNESTQRFDRLYFPKSKKTGY